MTGSLMFIGMNILCVLPRSKSSNVFDKVMKDQYATLTTSIPTSKSTSMHSADLSFDYWLVSYSITSRRLTDDGLLFVKYAFATLYELLEIKHMTIAAYYVQTTWKVQTRTKRWSRAYETTSPSTKITGKWTSKHWRTHVTPLIISKEVSSLSLFVKIWLAAKQEKYEKEGSWRDGD